MGLIEDAQALRAKLDAVQLATQVTVEDKLETMSEESVSSIAPLFPAWIAGESVVVGSIRSFNNTLYKCIQAHITQSDWTPVLTPALWVTVRNTGATGPTGPTGPTGASGASGASGPAIDPWVQPTGGHDAYQMNDMVTHNGQTWKSTVNANVWAPGVYGWVVV